ncbi:BTAD domain-containing putative transcriptional regulator [Streptomyces puniciscabiei]
MTFGILGPVRIQFSDRPLVELSGKQSMVLASLLLNVNTIVSRDRLVAELWDSPPPSAISNLQTYVAKLRRALPTETRLLTKGSGYLLRADTGELDLLVFDQEVGLARVDAERGEAEVAVERLERALSLWRGQPAEGTPLRGDSAAHAVEIEERRTQARLDYAEIKIGLGSPNEVVGDLRYLLIEQPLLERAWHLLVLALAQAGQRGKALDAYRRARDVLVEELGVEPGRDLRQLHATVLDGDIPFSVPNTRSRRVCQLPPDTADFVGRRSELPTVIQALCLGHHQVASWPAASTAPSALSVPVCVISGQAGMGKTVLAVHVAHHIRRQFPDGQLYINMQGGDAHPVDPEEALGRILRALEVDSATVPTGLDQRAELYRAKLANGRYLVVLDDVANEGQVYPLMPGTPGCAVLITSRRRLSGLPAAQMIDLPMMPSNEALELLRRVIGTGRAAEAPGDVDKLVQLCGGLPLALRIAGVKLAARPHWGVDQLVSRLSDSRNRLRHLSHGSQAVQASLAVGYKRLASPARRLFRLLGLLEAQDFAVWAAAALLQAPHGEAEDLMEQLVDDRLLDVAGQDRAGQTRFRFHDLTRCYAREYAEADEPEGQRIAAVRRALSAWLALARQAHMQLCEADSCLPDTSSSVWFPHSEIVERYVLPDPLGWLDAERGGINTAVRQSAALGASELCWELAYTVMHLSESCGLNDEWRTTYELTLRDVYGIRNGSAQLLHSSGSR